MKQKSIFIILSLVFSLAIQGCYTQLAWFYPSPEEEEETFEPYSRAGNRPNLSLYAQQSGSTMPLSYSMMHNRFNPLYSSYYGYSSFYNPYNFYGGYGNGYGGMGFYDYGYGYSLGGYNMVIPSISENEIRKFTKSRDRNTGTNLNTVRTRTQSQQSSSSRNGDSSYGGSSSLSSSRSSSGSSGGSSSSSGSSGGTRATRRN